MRKLLTLLFIISLSYSFEYIQNNIHSLIPSPNKLNISVSYLKSNKALDILHLRDKDLDKYNAIGDMSGYEIKTNYAINENILYSIKYMNQDIEFFGDTLSNKRVDIFARYHFKDLGLLNSGASIDVGVVFNHLDNFKTYNINTINKLIKRFTTKNVSIFYSDGKTGKPLPLEKGYYLKYKNNIKKLKENPYIGLTSNQDESLYLRFITGIVSSHNLLDFYIGYKTTKIKGKTDTTKELINLGKENGYNLIKNFKRDESSIFTGISDTLNIEKFIIEARYEYEKIFRKKELNYINYNHIFIGSLSYEINKKLYISIGGKIMYRQFNGQIPYLYNKYTQTTFDHKYGYAFFSINYIFNVN